MGGGEIMNTYKLSGESRQVGAIGIFEPFEVTLHAKNKDAARELTRSIMYNNNQEHVHIKAISRIPKYINEYVIQENWGYGWDDSTAEETRKAGLAQLKCYRENAYGRFSARMVTRKVINPEWIVKP
jgi:hypothetical protein